MQYIVVKKLKKSGIFKFACDGDDRKHKKNGDFHGWGGPVSPAVGRSSSRDESTDRTGDSYGIPG
jgi:hypothetical protein